MQLSSRGRYAVMAMVELAARPCDCAHPVTLGEIAACQQISLCYLEQLFGPLRRAGLVLSARGPGGGYWLGRPPCAISVADVLHAVDENLRATRCDATAPGCLRDDADRPVPCLTHGLWDALGRHIEQFLAGVTLAQIAAGAVPLPPSSADSLGLAPVGLLA